MKKYLAVLGLLSIIFITVFFIGCDCGNSNVPPGNYGNYDQNTTTGSTAIGTAVH
jgi:hypothetical protein